MRPLPTGQVAQCELPSNQDRLTQPFESFGEVQSTPVQLLGKNALARRAYEGMPLVPDQARFTTLTQKSFNWPLGFYFIPKR